GRTDLAGEIDGQAEEQQLRLPFLHEIDDLGVEPGTVTVALQGGDGGGDTPVGIGHGDADPSGTQIEGDDPHHRTTAFRASSRASSMASTSRPPATAISGCLPPPPFTARAASAMREPAS